MFQTSYYFYCYFKQFPNLDGEMSFSVPTGNFGDVLAGYYAKRMGLPTRHLIVATNANDILNRFFTTGVYDKYPVIQTFSPSMDIGISSNFERYLFYLFGEDSKKLNMMMEEFNKTGRLEVDKDLLKAAQEDFLAAVCTEDQTVETIARYHKDFGYTLDPHTACGVSAVDQMRAKMAPVCKSPKNKHLMVVLSTAHPAKFGAAVARATGCTVSLPTGLADLKDSEVRFQVLPASTQKIKTAIVDMLPDPTGARNVYTFKHHAAFSAMLAVAIGLGFALGKKF
ncbi:tryptophan synthase beta subunit-like PLP-dependent enzyme [Baffinella frigidus]|nr:tryptophan synthase beta subunit-like PLP-dependent enzyme [Cryptophyta sp. CCMP2293]